jgi:hypothetical protein
MWYQIVFCLHDAKCELRHNTNQSRKNSLLGCCFENSKNRIFLVFIVRDSYAGPVTLEIIFVGKGQQYCH